MDNDHNQTPHARQLRRRAPTGLAFGPHHGEQLSGPLHRERPGSEAQIDSSGVSLARLRFEEEQAHYNAQYLLAPVGYFLVGLDSAILQVNLVGADMLGIARANSFVHRFRDFVASRFAHDFDDLMERALNSLTPISCLLEMQRCATGEPFQVTLRASADGGGQACRVMLERADGQLAALERNEERFRRIVHNSEEGIWEIDALSRTTFVNPKMADMLGYSIEEMQDRPLIDFMDVEARSIMETNIARRQQGISERHEFKFIRKDGGEVWTTLVTNPIFDAVGNYLGALALVSDITERKESTELIWQQANFDSLTSLPNRHMFMDRLKLETKKADRGANFLALLFIDLDRFKDVNDSLGHAMGDLVLIEASRRIASCVRSSDTLARLGGDEFTVILAGLDHVGSVERIAQTMMSTLALPFSLNGEHAELSASIGIALYPPDASDIDQLVAHADQAMYASKNAGGNRFSYFTPDLQLAAQARLSMATDLRAAISAGQFEIVYQPIVSLQSGAVHKAEALLRWRHPTRGLLGAAEFIPFAESNGLIVEIGDWVFREAARQAQIWQRSIDPAFQISVNKSPVQFRGDADQYQSWIDYLEQLQLPPQSIVIEITESALLGGAEHVIERLRKYRAMGLQVALDDFGTGYSSLSHLTRFEIDYVKIDQSFVAALEDEAGELAICEAIILMAHRLGLKVVAEGVETKLQQALLVDAGCDYAQGYMFAHPLSAPDFEALANSQRP